MVRQFSNRQVVTVECPGVDAVLLCCDCLGVFVMRRVGNCNWQAEMQLPPGQHHLRYYRQTGRTTICLGQEALHIEPAPARSPEGDLTCDSA